MSDVGKWERNAALKYFEIHVAHRSHLFNMFLVILAASMVAYSELLKEHSFVAASLAAFTALIGVLFLLMQELTLRKTKEAKKIILSGSKVDGFNMLFGDGKIVLRKLRDTLLKKIFYIAVIAACAGAAIYACLVGLGSSDAFHFGSAPTAVFS